MTTKSDRDELKERLANRELNSEDGGFMTSTEIAIEMGWTEKRTLSRLRDLKNAGELEVAQVWRLNLADVVTRKPGYKLKKKDKETDG